MGDPGNLVFCRDLDHDHLQDPLPKTQRHLHHLHGHWDFCCDSITSDFDLHLSRLFGSDDALDDGRWNHTAGQYHMLARDCK